MTIERNGHTTHDRSKPFEMHFDLLRTCREGSVLKIKQL